MPLESAGILLFTRTPGADLEVFLVHPGGPLFAKKDKGWWGIPKGLPNAGESLEAAARREFGEETGYYLPSETSLLPLGQIKQKGGKIVHAWATEGNLPEDWVLKCNTFKQEWPPRSGQWKSFPEVDQGRFFSLAEARDYILPAQGEFLDRLVEEMSK